MALPAEARALTRFPPLVGSQRRLAGGAWLALSGIGSEQARAAGTRLLASGVTALVGWGVCGALAPGLAPGALVVPTRIFAADGRVYEASKSWHQRVCDRLAGHVEAHTGTVLEYPQVVTCVSEKQALYQRFGAVAVDMESAAVADLACQAGVPFIVIRTVVDPADVAIPAGVHRMIDGAGRLQISRVFAAMGWRGGDWLALIRLGRCFRAARRTLVQVMVHAGETVLAGELTPKGPKAGKQALDMTSSPDS